MWKNVFKIYKQDIKKITANWVAIVILLGLAFLPSLYAWVNIGASWDPYSNTKGVKVGIVNEDKGAELKGKQINIGDGVVESLKKNKKLGWIFYSNTENGKNAAEKGQVYATIVIPEDFSHKLGTVLDANPVKPKLEYYVNEKINAIAPKMTDSGATTIQRQISTSFVDTAIKKCFEIFNKLGIELNDHYPQIEKYKTTLFEIDEEFPDVYKKIDKIAATANDGLVELDSKNEDVKDVQRILEKTSSFMEDISKNLVNSNEKISDSSANLKENLALIQTILSNVSKTTKELDESIVNDKPETINKLNNAISDLEDLNNNLNDTANKIDKSGVDISGALKKKNAEISNSINEDKSLLTKLKTNISTTQNDITPILNSLIKTSDNCVTQIDDMIKLVDNSFNSADVVLTNMENLCDTIDSILTLLPTEADSVKASANTLIDNAITQVKELKKNPLYANTLPLDKILAELNALKKLLNNNATSQQIQEAIKTLVIINSECKSSISKLEKDVSKQHDAIDKNFDQTRETAKAVSRLCSNLQTTLDTGSVDAIKKLDSTIANLDEANKDIKNITDKLSVAIPEDTSTITYNLRKLSPSLQALKKTLVELRDKAKKQDNIESTMYELNKLTFNLEALTQKILVGLNGDILPMIETYLKNSAIFALDIKNILNSSSKDLDLIHRFIDTANKKGKMTVDELNDVKKKLPKIEKDLHDITDKIKEFEKTAKLQDVIDLLKKDGNTEGNFISQPVELNTHKLFSMQNYGAAMTPFYSTLSLWVGTLILTALLSTKAKNVDFKFTPREEFFGKYLLFATLAFLQGFIVCVGDILLLGLHAQEPVLFVCLGVFYSLVFTMIVYTLVAIFGNVGKALGVILLVVQLAGSGGTFPIEVTPKVFQIIYSMLPFTYAINGMREAIAGVVYHSLLIDISVLLGFFFIFMIIGITLKKWVNKLMKKLNHKLSESGIVEH